MKRILFYTLLVILLNFARGCDFAGSTIVGYFVLVSSSESGRSSASLIQAQGDIEKINAIQKQGGFIYGGRLSVNGINVPFDSSFLDKKVDYSAFLMGRVEIKKVDSSSKKPYSIQIPANETDRLFGAYVRWVLSGNPKTGISKFDEQTYSPKAIFLLHEPGDKISNSAFNIKWNADTANKSGVNITVYYTGTRSNRIAAGKANILWQSPTLIPDNGFYTISYDITKKFPENGYVVISIDRRSEKRIKKGLNQQFVFMCISNSSGIFEIESGRLALIPNRYQSEQKEIPPLLRGSHIILGLKCDKQHKKCHSELVPESMDLSAFNQKMRLGGVSIFL